MSVDHNGPILIEGPVEIAREDGTIASSDRFVVAVCTCRRSRIYPWCDTSHRRHPKPPGGGHHDESPGSEAKGTHDGDHH